MFDPQTVTLVDGAASLDITPIAGVVDGVRGGEPGRDLAGSSNPFEVVAGSAAGTLRVVEGDGQTGEAGSTLSPIVVEVTDGDGAPIEGAGVLFVHVRGPRAGSTW